MFTRKRITLAALVLGIAALVPASAPADTGGTDRPVMGTISGTTSVNVQTGAFTSEATGIAAHLGGYTTNLAGTVAITPAGTVGSGAQTVMAANGDELNATYTLETPAVGPGAHTTTIITTISGGTGRFSEATGTLTSVVEVSPVSFDGVTLVTSAEGTTSGQISY